jgi:RNA polymerase sigma-70 factor, ECF subfamily
VETAPSQFDDLVLPSSTSTAVDQQTLSCSEFPPDLLLKLWQRAEAETCGLTPEEFGQALVALGAKHNHGLPPGASPDPAQKASFFEALHLSDLALAYSCALGRELAWERFFSLYREPLTRAATAITGSATVGHDLADSIYSELFGLRQVDGQRRSPLASYSGRGSLMGWLRTILAQRHVDHHRRMHREAPLDSLDVAPQAPSVAPATAQFERLNHAISVTLRGLDSSDRFLLVAYFLDGRTLIQIARILGVHEATISRRLKRLVTDLRKQLLHHLQAGGLSKRAAEEALGADPRDLETNLRALLQASQSSSFSVKAESSLTKTSDPA